MKLIKVPVEVHSLLLKLKKGNEPIHETISRHLSVKPTTVKKSKEPTHTAVLGRLFKEEYLKKFEHPYPAWGPKENGQLANWLKSVPFDYAESLIKLYMQWTNPFVVRSGHTLGLLVTRHVELATDVARAKGKKNLLVKHEREKEVIASYAAIERHEQENGNIQRSKDRISSVQDSTQGGLPGPSGDPFTGEGAFGLPDKTPLY